MDTKATRARARAHVRTQMTHERAQTHVDHRTTTTALTANPGAMPGLHPLRVQCRARSRMLASERASVETRARASAVPLTVSSGVGKRPRRWHRRPRRRPHSARICARMWQLAWLRRCVAPRTLRWALVHPCALSRLRRFSRAMHDVLIYACFRAFVCVHEQGGHLDLPGVLSAFGFAPAGDSAAQVRSAYRRAALRLHPDRTRTAPLARQVECEEMFKLIQAKLEANSG